MKHLTVLLVFTLLLTHGACNPSDDGAGNPQNNENNGNAIDPGNEENMRIKVIIGETVFMASMADNPAAKAFKELLPLTLNMEDVNGNEKFFRLDQSLPASASNPGTIREGDLMLWGSDGVVLFYETFPTSYSYTRLGSVENASGLKECLGTGYATLKFE